MTANAATTFDRAKIMKAAHTTAKWRVASVGGAYRQWFAKTLSFEWKKAKAAIAREQSNLGLPLRSCLADAPARPRAMQFGSVRVFSGPGAHQAAIESAAAQIGGGFQRSRNLGRRAADWS